SVLEQTFPNFDVWIVDDGSDARTSVLCDELSGDSRVHVLRNERPSGAAAARNRGIWASAGEYLAFIDDDCTWHPERLERIDAHLRGRREPSGYIATQTVVMTGGPPPRFTL